jgi:hypothetical protein
MNVSDHEQTRRDDGRIAEHWDVLRPVPTKSRPRAELVRLRAVVGDACRMRRVTLDSSMQETSEGSNNTMATNPDRHARL